MLRWLIILIMTSSWIVSTAQDCPRLKGQVFDLETRESLPGANIVSTKNNQRGTTAIDAGSFEFTSDKEDTLLVSFIGYESKKIAVSSAESCFLAIYLQPISKKIPEIEIKAERIIAEEFTIKKIRKLDIYTNPSAKADPILAVNAMPSATTTDESANISLRGGSPAETGIFFNNVPINDAVRYSQLNGIGTFSIFNTALINNVQVYPGNPPLEFGNSTSGLISLQTDESIPSKSVNSISLTLASNGFYSARKLTRNSSLTFFSNYQPSLLIRKVNRNSLKDLKGFSSLDLGIHYFAKLASNTIIKIFNYSIRESYKFHFPQPTYDGVFNQNKLRNFTVGNFRRHYGNTAISVNCGMSVSKAEYRYGITNIDLRLNDLYASFNIHRTGKVREWKTGISYDHKASDFNGAFPIYDFAIGENHPVGHADQNDHVSNPEWYGYIKQYLGSKWIAGVGIRKNIAIEALKNYTSMQANLNYRPKENWNINFSAGKYHKYQLPQGEAEGPVLIESNQFSCDVNYSKQKLENSFSVFYKRNSINAVQSEITGVEVFSRYRVNTNLRFQISLTSLNSFKVDNGIKEPTMYNIHYFLRGNIEYKIQGTWTITTVFLFRQGSFYHPLEGTIYNETLQVFEPRYSAVPGRLPGYGTIDLSVSKIFPFTQKSTAIVFLSAGNIANFKNVRTYSYNFDYTERKEYLFSQRTLYCGVVINF